MLSTTFSLFALLLISVSQMDAQPSTSSTSSEPVTTKAPPIHNYCRTFKSKPATVEDAVIKMNLVRDGRLTIKPPKNVNYELNLLTDYGVAHEDPNSPSPFSIDATTKKGNYKVDVPLTANEYFAQFFPSDGTKYPVKVCWTIKYGEKIPKCSKKGTLKVDRAYWQGICKIDVPKKNTRQQIEVKIDSHHVYIIDHPVELKHMDDYDWKIDGPGSVKFYLRAGKAETFYLMFANYNEKIPGKLNYEYAISMVL